MIILGMSMKAIGLSVADIMEPITTTKPAIKAIRLPIDIFSNPLN